MLFTFGTDEILSVCRNEVIAASYVGGLTKPFERKVAYYHMQSSNSRIGSNPASPIALQWRCIHVAVALTGAAGNTRRGFHRFARIHDAAARDLEKARAHVVLR